MAQSPLAFKVRISPVDLLDMPKGTMKRTLLKAGREVAAVARRSVMTAVGTGRLYYIGGKLHRASAPGEAPVNLGGDLARSIAVLPFPTGEGVAIRDAAFYSYFLEYGAKGGGGNTSPGNLLKAGETGRNGKVLRGKNRMKASAISKSRVLAPRPFLEPALQARESSIESRVKAALIDGITFKRQRP